MGDRMFELMMQKNDEAVAARALLWDMTVSNEKLRKAARAVVDARYYNGEDGWDRLKNAIGELEDIVGRSNGV